MTELKAWVGWSLKALKTRESLGDRNRKNKRDARRLKEKREALKVLEEKAPSLFLGERDVSLEQTELEAILRCLGEGACNHDYRDRYNFLVTGLVKGVRELGWRLDVPSPIRVYHPPKSAISVDGQRRGRPYRELLQIASQHLEWQRSEVVIPGRKEARFSATQVEAGRLIFSAITRGALLNASWVTALPKAIERGPWSEEMGISLELRMRDIGAYRSVLDVTKAQATRRWFPDPITSMLLLRWYRKFGRSWLFSQEAPHYQIEVCLAAFLNALALPKALDIPRLTSQKNGRPRITRWLQEHACREAAKDYPGFLIHYASSLESGPSVPREAWLRLQTGLIAGDTNNETGHQEDRLGTPVRGEKSVPVQRALDGGRLGKDHKGALRRLNRCLLQRKEDAGSDRSTSKATRALERFIEASQDGPVVLTLIAQWLLYRLRRRSLNEKKLALSSAKQYLQSIGKPLLVASLDDPDVGSYDGDDWTELYEKAILISPSRESQAYRRQRLHQFHTWLCREYSVPQVDLDPDSATPRNVDANFLTPREYSRAVEWLECIPNQRQASTCSLVLTIAYRCGMRRGEVARLRLQDLEGLMEPGFGKVSIRMMNQRGHKLKSLSSVRRIPAWLLFTDEELQKLRRWVGQRKHELGGDRQNAFLFSPEGSSTSIAYDNDCFKLVTRAMQSASGDPTIRFHHNRHSFATFNFLRLLEAEPGELTLDHWVMDERGKALLPHWGKDFSQLADLGSAGAPTQSHLWELCTWCGHLSPGETMSTYSHLLDWMLGVYLCKRRDPELSLTQQAQLLGVGDSGIEKFRGRNGLSGQTRAQEFQYILRRKWKRSFVKTHWFRSKLPAQPELQATENSPLDRVSPMLLYDMFSALDKLSQRDVHLAQMPEGDAFRALADSYDLPLAAIREWFYRAELLSNTTTQRNTPQLRFHRTQYRKERMLPETRPDHAPALEILIAPPRGKVLKAESDKVFRHLTELFANEPAMVMDVLAACAKSFQRSKTQIKLRNVADKRDFLRVIDSIGLKGRAFVDLVVAPELDAKAAKTYWSEALGVSAERIKVRGGKPGQSRPLPNGTAHIDFYPDRRGNRSTWTVVEFVLVSAVILLPPIERVGGILVDDRKRSRSVTNAA